MLLSAMVLAVVVGAVVFASQMASTPARQAMAVVEVTAGEFTTSNSKNGQAIFSARDMGPGSSTSGRTTIANNGEVAGSFTLSKTGLVDEPGPNGGPLSDLADLVVTDVTRPGAPATVYAGRLAAMPDLAIGTFGPGESHTYDFKVSMPADAPPASSPTDINAYQSSSVQVGYAWTGTAVDPPDNPPPPPPPPDGPPVGPSTSPGGATASPGGATVPPGPAKPSAGATASPTRPGAPPQTATTGGPQPAPHTEASPPPAPAGVAASRAPEAAGEAVAPSDSEVETAKPGAAGRASGRGGPRGRRGGRARPAEPRSLPSPRAEPRRPKSSTLDALKQAAVTVGKHAAFPLVLLLMMVGFFYAQNWLDRRDPKLALAPVDPEPLRRFG